MLVNFLYGHSFGVLCFSVITTVVGLALAGLFVVHHTFDLRLRKSHNSLIGCNIAVVGTFYAVLLAFIAVEVWVNFDKAQMIAADEASTTGDLYRDAMSLPQPVRGRMIGDIRKYLDVVVGTEWPAMALGQSIDSAGWQPLFALSDDLQGFHTADSVQGAVFGQVLGSLNDLYGARRSRLLAAGDRLPTAVWMVILSGLVVTVSLSLLFGMEKILMHALMVGGTAASIGLVLVLIISFDYPFRGSVQVAPEGFIMLRHNIDLVSSDK